MRFILASGADSSEVGKGRGGVGVDAANAFTEEPLFVNDKTGSGNIDENSSLLLY